MSNAGILIFKYEQDVSSNSSSNSKSKSFAANLRGLARIGIKNSVKIREIGGWVWLLLGFWVQIWNCRDVSKTLDARQAEINL